MTSCPEKRSRKYSRIFESLGRENRPVIIFEIGANALIKRLFPFFVSFGRRSIFHYPEVSHLLHPFSRSEHHSIISKVLTSKVLQCWTPVRGSASSCRKPDFAQNEVGSVIFLPLNVARIAPHSPSPDNRGFFRLSRGRCYSQFFIGTSCH